MTATLVPTTTGDLAGMPTREEAEASALHMATEFAECTAEMRRCMDGLRAAGLRLQAAFSKADADHLGTFNRFDVEVKFDGHSVYRHDDGRDDYADLFNAMRRNAWRMLIDHLGVKNVMSVAKRDKFESQLNNGDMPDVTAEAIIATIFGLADQAKDFATEAAREVFDFLRPQREHYKTNSSFRVGRRVIMGWWVERRYDGKGFRPQYHHEKHMIALDGVFHMMDGRGMMKDRISPLIQAIKASNDGKGETDFFRFKCFKNGNLHLEFKRLDLVKQLNGLAAGEFVLGADTD